MIDAYIEKWISVIEQMNTDNTYKLAWARAILECIWFDKCREHDKYVIVEFDDISECMLKYYWNQLFFFNLKQAPYKDKYPIICQDTIKLIEEYKKLNHTTIPAWFDDAKSRIDSELYQYTIKHISKTLHENVSWRFKIVNRESLDLYRYDKSKGSFIELNNTDIMHNIIKKHLLH